MLVHSVPPARSWAAGSGAHLPTRYGDFTIRTYTAPDGGPDHVALVHGELPAHGPVLVRVHSQCLTGDAFGSLRCDCGPQLRAALAALAANDPSVLVYLRQEGRGIGLKAKIEAYVLQDQGLDTYDANVAMGYPPDARTYGAAAAILTELGVASIRLLTNNPDKVRSLRELGLAVEEVIPLIVGANEHNRRYLRAKRERFGHLLPGTD